ncbi:iron-containing alcohol dehydrogenase [Clostridium sp. AM58-1XD]|uniref:iron-containing alcohol dehydrogenase n=1 Tax=Clostridium sp. AM58-1XD TaxID=2292307 RepID=UPI0011C1B10D
MRPMKTKPLKLGGEQLMLGTGCLNHLATLRGKRAFIVIGGGSMERAGIVSQAQEYLSQAGMESTVFKGVEPDPTFSTVKAGAKVMRDYGPDWIIAIGGGSVMDAAKSMWVLYEHSEITTLDQLKPPNTIPPLRKKAKFVCIPSTSGSASEVSRSIVITDDISHNKCGIGDMEMMPDVAICDPAVTASMPKHLTAETGMDALTHAIESWVSRRPNYISDTLARQAALDIVEWLPVAYRDGADMKAREMMLDASTAAGLAFTNSSLGIVHSMAHVIGSRFGISHGLGDAVILPYVIRFNCRNPQAKERYEVLARDMGGESLEEIVSELQIKLDIPSCLKEIIDDREQYLQMIPQMSREALLDGCTRTNPLVPSAEQFEELFRQAFLGSDYQAPEKKLKLVCYSSLGYPTMEKSLEMVDKYIEAGADTLELDIPSPDPYFESDVIARHMAAAFENCHDYDKYFEAIQEIRNKYPRVAVQLALYENTMERIGIDKVVAFCKKAGIDAMIYVGSERPDFQDKLLEGGIRLAAFVRYHMPEEEIETAKQTNGLVYLQAKPTYNNNVRPGYEALSDCVAYLRQRGILQEIYCGVGVYTPEDVRMIREAQADGVYIGSVLLEMEDDVEQIQAFIRSMKAETHESQ